MNEIINIAIDGPAGAGKSSVARKAAETLGYIYVDTGALYRAVGVATMRNAVDPKDEQGVSALLPSLDISLAFEEGIQHVLLNGQDVSEAIRTPEASMAASGVSAIPAVRAFLFDLQKDIAKKNNCIMDGRDIGTVVLPHAQVKIFLTASSAVRAQRRCKELAQKGIDEPYEKVLREIEERDYQDSHREIAPLKPAEDSILVDTSNLTLEGSIAAVVNTVKESLNK